MNDEEIIELYWKRDESAIEVTSTQYGSYCYSIAKNILHSHEDAEETVNDTWLKAWDMLPPERPSVLKMFLAKITRNLSLDRYRQSKAAKRGGGEIAAVIDELSECTSSMDVDEEIHAKELNRAIGSFLHTLRERDRDVFLRRYFYVEPVPLIAKRYGIKESNVLMVLSRTRQKLKDFLKQGDFIYD